MGIGDSGACVIGEGLKVNSSLKRLVLNRGVIYDDGVHLEIDDDLMIFVRWII